jgi:predicted 2-oxoglutarate/Fe(II)-dependent dioxygenase YbiX
MASYFVKELVQDIFVIENLLSPELCDEILRLVSGLKLEQAGIQIMQFDNAIRSNNLLYLGEQDAPLQSINQLLMEKVSLIQDFLKQHYGIHFSHAEPCSILQYQPGQFYKRHVDNLLFSSRFEEAAKGVPTRDVSVVGYLNDRFEGGETYFDRQKLKITPKRGTVIVFPAYWTHPHASLPVVSGTKYSFTTWLFH